MTWPCICIICAAISDITLMNTRDCSRWLVLKAWRAGAKGGEGRWVVHERLNRLGGNVSQGWVWGRWRSAAWWLKEGSVSERGDGNARDAWREAYTLKSKDVMLKLKVVYFGRKSLIFLGDLIHWCGSVGHLGKNTEDLGFLIPGHKVYSSK